MIKEPAGTSYHQLLRQVFPIRQGAQYRLTFTVLSEKPTSNRALLQGVKPPYPTICLREIEMTPTPQKVVIEGMYGSEDGQGNVLFDCGAAEANSIIWLSDISVEETL